jgi:hypothetical protein
MKKSQYTTHGNKKIKNIKNIKLKNIKNIKLKNIKNIKLKNIKNNLGSAFKRLL